MVAKLFTAGAGGSNESVLFATVSTPLERPVAVLELVFDVRVAPGV
jgi:hypothetical protein